MKYFANYTANNGTCLIREITDTNKARIIKVISDIANAERFAGSECRWYVHDERGVCVAMGYTSKTGQRFRVRGHDLYYYNLE